MSENLKNQSNPFSTGGGGVNFETRVQAVFAVSLFTRCSIPCLPPNLVAQEIKFQNKYEGSNTDDLVLSASDGADDQRKLYVQIKHGISIGDGEKTVFSEVINAAWNDFIGGQFDQQVDSIALITGPLSTGDIKNVIPLLELAKYSSRSDDFINKVSVEGFASKQKKEKLDAFRSQLNRAKEGEDVTNEELWLFLKSFFLVSYDLGSKNCTVVSLLCSLISRFSSSPSFLVLSSVTTCVQEFNQNAGVLNLSSAPDEVVSLFDLSETGNVDLDIRKLKDRGDHILSGVSSQINGCHIDREVQIGKISSLYSDFDFIFVTGSRGVGKSGVVKDFAESKSGDVPIFYLRAEDLDRSHLNDFFSSIGIFSSLKRIAEKFLLLREKILVIESLEKVLELTHQNAFVDLLRYVSSQSGWTVIATGRDYAYQQLIFSYLQPSGITFSSVNIEGFNESQVMELCDYIPKLKALQSHDSLVELLKTPFFAELAFRAINNGFLFKAGNTEADFKRAVWTSVISNESFRQGGMPVRRRKLFIRIAVERARKMVFGIRDSEYGPEVLLKLEEDGLIKRDAQLSLVSSM